MVRTKAGLVAIENFVFIEVILYLFVGNFSITLEICGRSELGR